MTSLQKNSVSYLLSAYSSKFSLHSLHAAILLLFLSDAERSSTKY